MASSSNKRILYSEEGSPPLPRRCDRSSPCVLESETVAVKKLCFELQTKLVSPSKSVPAVKNRTQETLHSASVVSEEETVDVASTKQSLIGSKRYTANFPLYIVESIDRRSDSFHISLRPVGNESSAPKKCSLNGFWQQTILSEGDQVMIIGKFDQDGMCVVDDENNLLVQHPEILISPTLIGGAFYCRRKTILQDMIRSEVTKDMFVGTLVHDLMQRIVVADFEKRKSYGTESKDPQDILDHLLRDPKYRQDMYALKLSPEKVNEICKEFLPNISSWSSQQLSTEVADIEEWIWSPRYGVKGRVDVTLKTAKGIYPVEIKTGKPSVFSVSHSAQVLLYTLLLSEKYRMEIDEGSIFYAKTGASNPVTSRKKEISSLIQVRNQLARYLKKSHIKDDKTFLNLPPPIDDERMCSNCQYATACTLYHKTVEVPWNLPQFPLSEQHFINTMVRENLAHLSEKSLDYFSKWMVMLYMEASEGQKNVSVLDLWSRKDPVEKHEEKKGFIGGLRIIDVKQSQNQHLIYTLFSQNLSTVIFNVGDLIIMREDSNEGSVTDLCTVFSFENEPVCRMEVLADRFFINPKLKTRKFRVDKFVFSSSAMAGSYDGLVKLMEKTEKAERLRKLLVEKITIC